MEQYPYSIEELRAGVEDATRQVESGHFYTNAEVNQMLQRHHLMIA